MLSNVKQVEVIVQDTESDSEEKGTHKQIGRNEAVDLLTPLQKKCLQYLSLTCTSHNNVNTAVEHPAKLDMKNSQDSTIIGNAAVSPSFLQKSSKNSQKVCSTMKGENLIAQVFTILDPSDLKQVLLVMAKYFPRTLEVLVLHKLSPLAAEVLTSKFDEMDSAFSESEQAEFYKTFYSVFEDPKLAMSTFLDGKEAFSAAALKSLLEGYLGFAV